MFYCFDVLKNKKTKQKTLVHAAASGPWERKTRVEVAQEPNLNSVWSQTEEELVGMVK
jgi:hypothetical protein